MRSAPYPLIAATFVILASAPKAFAANPIEKASLPNGAPLETALAPSQPRDTVVVTFMGGGGTIPKAKQGVGHVLFDMLRQGPTGLSREEYKDKLFYAGGSISFSTDARAAYLVVKAPPENMAAVLQLAREQLAKPKLNATVFEAAKQRVLTERIVANDDMRSVAGYFAPRHLTNYTPDMLNDEGSPWSIRNVTQADARKALADLFRWENAFYASTGPTPAAGLASKITANLWPEAPAQKPQAWRQAEYNRPAPLKGNAEVPEAVIIDKPKATDNQIYFYFPLQLQLDTPEALDATVAHEILGGGLTGQGRR